jgi:hypothetical protein
MSSAWHPCVLRRPKFTDEFEREMANDTTYHLGRDEPAMWPHLQQLGQHVARTALALARTWRLKPPIEAP